MRNKIQSKEFTSLLAAWNKKLEDSGFLDIENYSKVPMRKGWAKDLRARREYYRVLGLKFSEEEFIDQADRIIMEMTAAGKTIRAISKELKRLGLGNSNKDTIRYIRRRYENKWEIRSWKPEEMVSRRVKKPAIP